MKKTILIALSALLVISSFTACGKKDNTDKNDTMYSRVLYEDEEESSEEEINKESSSEEKLTESSDSSKESKDSETSKRNIKSSDSDSDKKNSSSSISSKPKTTSSRANTGAKVTNGSNNRTTSSNSSTAESSSSNASSNTVYTSSNDGTDTDSDTTDTDTWYDTDSDIVDTDTDSEIEKGYFDYSDMILPINGGQIEVNQDFSVAYELLGSTDDISETSNGKVYNYDGCTITTVFGADETEEYIASIKINSPNYSTSKGITFGSTYEDILKAYGDPEYGYTYTLGDRTLEFTFVSNNDSGDYVSEIIFS